MKIQLSPDEYDDHKRNFDGICRFCKAWAYGQAESEDTEKYCFECENRSVYGIKKALENGLITVQ
jgi:hypothetical protein